MRFYWKQFVGRRINWLIIIVILAVRLVTFRAGVKFTGEYPNVIENYIWYFAINLISLFLTPLYGLWIYDSCHLFDNIIFVLRVRNRFKMVLEYGKYTLVDALSFTFILNLTALPLIIIQSGGGITYFPFFILSMLSQFLYFSVFSFLFFAIFLLTGSGILSYLITCLYGAIDYVGAAFGPDTPWLYIGTGRTFFPDMDQYLKTHIPDFTNVCFFVTLLLILSIVCASLCSKRDFIGRNEGVNDE